MSKYFTKQERDSLTIVEKKNRIQELCFNAWLKAGCRGLFALATGVGKSRIGVKACQYIYGVGHAKVSYGSSNILLVVPTEKLRDKNWEDEFKKWDAMDAYSHIDRECYASLAKIKNKHYGLVILDEAHNITVNNAVFFKNNTVEGILSLTATEPKDDTKKFILSALSPTLVTYKLSEAVEDGIVNPYDIFIVYTTLDDLRRSITVKTKDKEFKVTERKKYDFLCKQVEDVRTEIAKTSSKISEFRSGPIYAQHYELYRQTIQFENKRDFVKSLPKVKGWKIVHESSEWTQPAMTDEEHDIFIQNDANVFEVENVPNMNSYEIDQLYDYKNLMKSKEYLDQKHTHKMLERMRFIYRLQSKTDAARIVLDHFIDKQTRHVVFCGSIDQAEELCAPNTFHSKTKSVAYNAFQNFEINELGVCEALNEGHNLPDVFECLIVQLNSNDLDLIQRIGRIVRFVEDMVSKVWIICCRDTQDEVWLSKSLKTFNQDCIHQFDLQDLIDTI